MRNLVIAGAVALFAASQAPAQVASSPAPAPAAKPQADGDKIVCKSEKMVGSNISTRICRTKTEWEISRETNKRTLDRYNGELRAPTPRSSG